MWQSGLSQQGPGVGDDDSSPRKWHSGPERMLQVTQGNALLGGTEVGSERRGSLGGRGEEGEEEAPPGD